MESKPLTAPRIASPCTADWDAMAGDERRRFCSQCNLHVYNLSAMSEAEAAAFIGEAEGRTCVRYYRRSDGTFLTRDCPVGLRALRRKVAALAAGAAALFGFITLGIFSARANSLGGNAGAPTAGPVEKLQECTDDRPATVAMGMMCIPAPPVPTPPILIVEEGAEFENAAGDR